MDINISVWKDAAESIDKVADVIAKLGKMIDTCTSRGVELFDWYSANKATRELTYLLRRSTDMVTSQSASFTPRVDDYIDDPDPDKWGEIRDRIRERLDAVRGLLAQLDLSADEIVTKEFYAEFTLTLQRRQYTLSKLMEISAPTTPEAMAAMKNFVASYKEMIEQLNRVNTALAAYIEDRKAKRKWPTRT